MTTIKISRASAERLRFAALAAVGAAACGGGSSAAVDAAQQRDAALSDSPKVVRFAPKVDFATGDTPNSVAIGDLNGGGVLDLAVANYGASSISVLENTTAAKATTPSFASALAFDVGVNPHAVAIADFNGDGQLDLAVTNSNDSSVSVLLNTTAASGGPPSFSPSVEFATGDVPEIVAIGDFNGDGLPDLAIVNFASGTVSVLLNTTPSGATTPSFSDKTDFTTGVNPQAVAIADFNSDGKLDLAVADGGANTTSIFLNTTESNAATPSFAARTAIVGGSNPDSIAIGDFNTDGKPDFAVVNFNSASVTVFLNTTVTNASTATFASGLELPVGVNPTSVAVADIDGDGTPDLAVANGEASTASVFLNTTHSNATTPSFSAKVDFATGTSPSSIALGDLNGDGNVDLVTANINDATVSVLFAE